MIKPLSVLFLALLAPSAFALSPVPYYETSPRVPAVEPVQGVAMVRVLAELKAKGPLQQPCEVLRQRYGFVLDEGFAPQAVPNDKEFTILPYPAEPRPMVYLVKGFVAEGRVQDLSKDPLVRKVVQEKDPQVTPSREQLIKFIQQMGRLIMSVKGVASVSVSQTDLVITLDGSVPEAEVAKALEEKLPGFGKLPHRFEAAPESAKKAPRYTTQA